MKIAVASILIALGLYRLWRHRHPRFGGMQVGFRDLTVWSFLMATAHGAGVMLLPFLMGLSDNVDFTAAAGHSHHISSASLPALIAGTMPGKTAAMLVGVHTVAYLLVMTLVAWIVYSKLGLALLRTAWFNLDWLWAAALVVA